MDKWVRKLMLRSRRDVLIGTALITLISVASPVLVFMVALADVAIPSGLYWRIIGICAVIPLLIAPPIAVFALSVMRQLTLSIDEKLGLRGTYL